MGRFWLEAVVAVCMWATSRYEESVITVVNKMASRGRRGMERFEMSVTKSAALRESCLIAF